VDERKLGENLSLRYLRQHSRRILGDILQFFLHRRSMALKKPPFHDSAMSSSWDREMTSNDMPKKALCGEMTSPHGNLPADGACLRYRAAAEEDAELVVSSGKLLGGAAGRLLEVLLDLQKAPPTGNFQSFPLADLTAAVERALRATQAAPSPATNVAAELQLVVNLLESRRNDAATQASRMSSGSDGEQAALELLAITRELEAAQRCLHASLEHHHADDESGEHRERDAVGPSLKTLAEATDEVLRQIKAASDAIQNGDNSGQAGDEIATLAEEMRVARRDLLLVHRALRGAASVDMRVDLDGDLSDTRSKGWGSPSGSTKPWTLRGNKTVSSALEGGVRVWAGRTNESQVSQPGRPAWGRRFVGHFESTGPADSNLRDIAQDLKLAVGGERSHGCTFQWGNHPSQPSSGNIYVCVCTYVYTYVCMHACMYVCIYVYIRTYLYVYILVYTVEAS
jgi:hypothetical protein